MSRPYLEWIDENQKKCRLEIVDKIFIGRTCMGIDETKRIIVKHKLASRDHAVITLIGSRLQITDRSKNGTRVNNVRLTAGSSHYLTDGDKIQVGETVIQVKSPDLATKDKEDIDTNIDKTIVTPMNIIVTNLVADVRGFSGMTQTEDSSQVYALMKEIISTFSDIVYDCKGTIKDYVGDAVYAFWTIVLCQARSRRYWPARLLSNRPSP